MTRAEFCAFVRMHDNFVILTHRRPDGDTIGSAGALFDDADKGAYWRGEIDIPVDLQYMIGVAIGVPDEVPEQKPRDPSHYKTIR